MEPITPKTSTGIDASDIDRYPYQMGRVCYRGSDRPKQLRAELLREGWTEADLPIIDRRTDERI